MEIKAGDKVRIKSWKKLLEENSEFHNLNRGPSFVDEMREFCGVELAVFKVWEHEEDEDSQVHTWFEAEDDACEFYFSDWMVEEVISNEV